MFMLLEDLEGLHRIPPDISNTNFTKIEPILLNQGFTNSEITSIIQTWKPEESYNFLSGKITEDSITWTFINSFVFSFHICSTIGYGDVAPKTSQGQLICIFYGIIGIPIHILFFKILSHSYHEAYAETTMLVKGDSQNVGMKLLAGLCFFAPWATTLVLVPATIFMFTDKWTFLEGIYYCFITLTTVGLGDYVAGEKMKKDNFYILYKISTLMWIMYGLAFFLMMMDLLSRQFTKFCLFRVEIKDRKLNVFRVGMDIERLDVHFRLLKPEGMEFSTGILEEEQKPIHAKLFRDEHLRHMYSVARHLQALISEDLGQKGSTKDLTISYAPRSKSNEKDISVENSPTN
ncbi:hypothetical protein JTE90_001778 [Oedothorax gibbosus]|uniref:Potassium channel domain-containing protein n=1 Tax=Oedothorax gibbosus TaxID=931172 RepID=A0AAV6VT69_9ARAC|nr:hypothetical protein JTE90_001778 [Oedothorax gibbosus]